MHDKTAGSLAQCLQYKWRSCGIFLLKLPTQLDEISCLRLLINLIDLYCIVTFTQNTGIHLLESGDLIITFRNALEITDLKRVVVHCMGQTMSKYLYLLYYF